MLYPLHTSPSPHLQLELDLNVCLGRTGWGGVELRSEVYTEALKRKPYRRKCTTLRTDAAEAWGADSEGARPAEEKTVTLGQLSLLTPQHLPVMLHLMY